MPFYQHVLSNGLQVVAELNDSAQSIASGFFVKTGSRDEQPGEHGLAHFLEHMCFKGGGKRDALQVNRDLDRVGARSNAQTSEEDTIYYTACLPEYLPKAFDVLAEILRPKLDEGDFTTEKEVILEEIKMYQDEAMSVAYEKAKATHFASHDIGRPIIGTAQSIKDMTIDRMRNYFGRWYAPSNITLAFTGRSDWNELVELAEAHCGSWTGEGNANRIATPARGSCQFAGIERAQDNQATVVCVSDGPPLESDDRYAASLAARMLGDSSGSRLYWTLIDTGQADQAGISYQEFNQAGAFFTFLSCDPEMAQENLDAVAQVYLESIQQGFSEQELTQAKNKVLSRSVLQGERPMGRLLSLGYYWVYQRKYVSVQDEIDAYTKVTLDDVHRVMREWPLLPMTVSVAGPKVDLRLPA